MHWIEKNYGRQGDFFFTEKDLHDDVQNRANLARIHQLTSYSYGPNNYTLEQTEQILAILNKE